MPGMSPNYESFRKLISDLIQPLTALDLKSRSTAASVLYLEQVVQAAFANKTLPGRLSTIATAMDNVARIGNVPLKEKVLLLERLQAVVAGSAAYKNAFRFQGDTSPDAVRQNIGGVQPRKARYDTPGARIGLEREYGVEQVRIADTELRKLGSSVGELEHVYKESGGEITRWVGRTEVIPGVMENVNVVQRKNGQIINSLQRQYRSFFSSIGRDLGEFLKWSIAASLIYIPLRKMNELLQQAIQIQSKLADVQVALASSTGAVNKVFESAAVVAREMGVELTGVIDGYVLAVRATGNITNETERLAMAEVLLRDSMTLAKLSGMDQARALDTLVGSLRQLGLPLDKGAELLDKWVAVTKHANVDLNTLASSFAIASTAAGDAGVDIDQLNGIIAALAESTILSGEETGNAIRGFVAGFQTEKSEAELRKYGIAVHDTQGELRSFIDVIEEIVEKGDIGLISDKQLAEIANAIGGGYRRGAQISAFLRNYTRAQEVATVSSEANGDAAAALAVKLDTLQTSITNLGNAFSEFARALGQEGGILESGSATVELLTKFVDVLTTLTKFLGDATPKILAFAAAYLILRRNIGFQELLQLSPAILASRLPLGIGGKVGPALGKTGLGSSPLSGIFSRGGGAVGGAAVGALSAIPSAMQGDYGKAGVEIGGAAVGALLTGGSPIGAIIGASAVDAFYTGIVDKQGNLVDYFASLLYEAKNKTPPPEDTGKSSQQLAQERLYTAAGKYGLAGIPGGGIKTGQALSAMFGPLLGQTQEESVTGFLLGLVKIGEIPPEVAAQIDADIKLLQEAAERKVEEQGLVTSPFGKMEKVVGETFGPLATQLYRKQLEQMRMDLGKGLVNAADYKRFRDTGAAIKADITELYTALGELGATSATGVSTGAEAFAELSDVILEATPEERALLQGLTDDVRELTNALLEGDFENNSRRIQAAAKLATAQQELIQTTASVQGTGQYKAFNIPEPIYVKEGLSQDELVGIVQSAAEASTAWVEEITLDPDEQQKIFDSFVEPVFQAGDVIGKYLGDLGLDLKVKPDILNQLLEEAGALADKSKGLSIQQPDISTKQWEQEILPQLPGVVSWLQGKFGKDNITTEDIGFLFNDKGTDIINTNLLAVQLLLERLNDTAEKQLEGVFNLPEGMAALLPFTGQGYFYTQSMQQSGGISGLGFPYAAGEPVPVEVTNLSSPNATWEDVITSRAAGNQAGFKEYPTNQYPREEKITAPADDVNDLAIAARYAAFSLDAYNQSIAGALNYGRRETITGADKGTKAEKIDLETTPLGSILNTLELLLQGIGSTGAGLALPGIAGGGMVGGMVGGMAGGGMDTLLGSLSAAVEKLLPSQIPISTNTTIQTSNMIYIDGAQIQKSANKQMFKDFKLAKRRVGTLGFVTE